MLGYVIFQSRKLNRDLIRAETGLIEAKDRYKALVESSNEGHILEVDGREYLFQFYACRKCWAIQRKGDFFSSAHGNFSIRDQA
jgi:hypothetical protein